MKTKLFGKITLVGLALMIALSFGFMSPMLMSNVSAATEVAEVKSGETILLTGYKSEFNLDTEELTSFSMSDGSELKGIALPKATLKNPGSNEIKITVRNSAGKIIEYKKSADTQPVNFLNITESDSYTVTYSVTNDAGVTTATRNIVINVTTEEVEFEFPKNVEQIIPSVAVKGDTIVFPKATLKQGDKTLADEITFSLKNGTTVKALDDKEGFKTYTIKEGDKGTFTAEYSYLNNGEKLSKKFTFDVVTNAPEVELKYKGYTSSLENLKFYVGQEVNLPKPIVVNKKADNVEVSEEYLQTIVTIKNKNTDDAAEVIKDFKFTPKKDGDYLVTYKTTDFAGKHSCGSQINKNYVKKSGESISLKVVDAYSLNAIDEKTLDDFEDASHAIPSIVYKLEEGKTVDFPALYAKGGWGNYNNLKLTRTIYKNNSLQKVLEETKKNGSDELYKANEVAKYTFDNAGTYTIRYEASYIDDNGKSFGYDTTKQLPSFTIVVEKVDEDVTQTDLSIVAPNAMPKATKKGNTITFDAPVVNDFKKGTSIIADKNLKVEVNYTYSQDNSVKSEVLKATKNEDGKYSIKIEKPANGDGWWTNINKLNITFKVTNDLGQVETASATVQIVDYSSDVVAPELASVVPVAPAPTDKIALSKVTFNDASSSMRVVAYVIKDNKVLKTFNSETGTNVVLQELEYIPNEEGDYTITYVATDQNNNTTTYSELYKVEFKNGFTVSMDKISAQEYGTRLNVLDKVTVTKNGKSVDMSTITVKMTNKEVTQETLNNLANNSLLIQVQGDYDYPAFERLDGEIVTLEGDITVRAWAKTDSICDLDANGSAKITFTSSDTKAPIFTIEDESLDNSSYNFNTEEPSATDEIIVPWFDKINDGNGAGIDYESLKITLTYQNDDESKPFKEFTKKDFDALSASEQLKFKPTKQGKVNAVYSVKDVNNREATRTFVLNVGDVVAPEIVVSEDAITAPKKVASDGKIVIDLDKIKIENDVISSDKINVVVKRDGTVVESNKNDNTITINANTAGTYVITFDVKDKANNSAQTITKTFTVSNDVVKATNTSTVWFTILIIISLIVLGLVIFFFVKPTKSKEASTKTLKTKEKDDK